MENLTHALYMAFAFLTFVIAFTYSLSMVRQLNDTAKTLVYRIDETNYYDALVLDDFIENNDNVDNKTSKIVGIETIIPTLYRYYKESFAVKILDKDGTLLQLFDTTTEGSVMSATSTLSDKRTPEQNALLSLYGVSATGTYNKCYMHGAPWLGNTNKDAKARIDMYISGSKGYINNTWVDYSDNNLNEFTGKKFKEIFTQYAYEGDTIVGDSTEDGYDELITLTGTKQVSTKIIITYQLLD